MLCGHAVMAYTDYARYIGSANDYSHSFNQRAMALDPAGGDCYIVGTVDGTWAVGTYSLNGYGSLFTGTGYLTTSSPCGYVLKVNRNLTVAWAKNIAGTNADQAQCTGVAADSSGNVYVVGYFNGTIKIGSTSLTSADANVANSDIFIAKLNGASGNVMWAKRWGVVGNDTPSKAVCDKSGNMFFTGSSSGKAIIVKFDNNGACCWGKIRSGSYESCGNDLVADKTGAIYYTGYNKGTASDEKRLFVAKYSADGTVVFDKYWAQHKWVGYGIAFDSKGNIVVAGDSTDGWTEAGFVAVVDSSAQNAQPLTIASGSESHAYDIAVDGDDTIFVIGKFWGSADFGDGNVVNCYDDNIFIHDYSNEDIFVATYKFDSAGNALNLIGVRHGFPDAETNDCGQEIKAGRDGTLGWIGYTNWAPGVGDYSHTYVDLAANGCAPVVATGAEVSVAFPGAGFSLVSVPFSDTSIADAETLAKGIPNCTAVWYWDAAAQNWSGHPKGTIIRNFAVVPGGVYLASVSGAGTFSQEGTWASVSYAIKKGYNLVSLPNSQQSVTTAEELVQAVANCTAVWQWDTDAQSWYGHPKGTIIKNFDVHVGQPYLINVTADGVWP